VRSAAIAFGSWLLGEIDRLRLRVAGARRGLRPISRLRFAGTIAGAEVELELDRARDLEVRLAPAPHAWTLSFDIPNAAVLEGDAIAALAIFSARVRNGLLGARRASLRETALSVTWTLPRSVEAIVAAIDRSVALLDQVIGPADLAPRLAHNVRNDPVPAMRLRSLLALLDHFDGAPELSFALKGALFDSEPEVRLVAARRSAPDEATTALIALIVDKKLPAGLRARAVDGLPAGSPEVMKETRAAIQTALYAEDPVLALAAVRGMVRLAPEQVVDRLGGIAPSAHRTVARAIAVELGKSKDLAAEPVLVALAARTNDPELAAAVADALAQLRSS
jgi:hypothetical protein